MSSTTDQHPPPPQRPGYFRQGSSTFSAKQKVVNLGELGLLPTKGQRPGARRSKHTALSSSPPSSILPSNLAACHLFCFSETSVLKSGFEYASSHELTPLPAF